MFIQTEKTPDPATLRFLPGRAVLDDGPVEFADAEAARASPLAERLFRIEAVRRVSLGADDIAVTRAGDADWQLLKPAILGVIMEHFLAGRPVLAAGAGARADDDAADEDVVAAIEELLDARIRPGLAQAGGDIVLRDYRDGVAELELGGGGFGEPLFAIEARVENTLRHYVPGVEAVRFVPGAERQAAGATLDRDDPEVAAVQALLEEEVNPAIAAHGGHIALIDLRDHAVYIRLEGGCQGCGMADVTLKQGVEVAIKRAVPTITAVLDTTDHAGGANPYYDPGKGGLSPL